MHKVFIEGGLIRKLGSVEICSSPLSGALVRPRELEHRRAVEGLIDMLRRLIGRAREEGLRLAPFIGIGCPGQIEPDGAIDRGAQNLPGDWEGNRSIFRPP